MTSDPVAVFLAQKRPFVKSLFVIGSAVLIQLSLGTYHTFGNMLPYMASYMKKYTNHSIKTEKFMWIPMFQGCFPFAMIIGSFCATKYGTRKAAAFGCFLTSFGVFLSFWSIKHSFALFLLTYGFMFGLGQGIAYVIAMSSVINWTPEAIGFATGLVAAGFGFSSSIFTPIQTFLINPENYSPKLNGYFTQQDMLQRVPDCFIKLSFVYGIMQFIGLIFICDPPTEFIKSNYNNNSDMSSFNQNRFNCTKSEKKKANLKLRDASERTACKYMQVSQSESFDEGVLENHITNVSKIKKHVSDSDSSSESDLEIVKTISSKKCTLESSISLTTREMLQSSTFYLLFMTLFCCSFYGNMFYNLYKTYGEEFISDDYFLAMAFSVGSISNAIARIFWGFLADRISFQKSLLIATFWAFILLITMPITSFFGKYLFLLWLIMMFICMGATHTLFIIATVRCFGLRYKSTNYGFLILSTTISGILLALCSQNFLENIGYKWAFIFTSFFSLTGLILTFSIQSTSLGHLIT